MPELARKYESRGRYYYGDIHSSTLRKTYNNGNPFASPYQRPVETPRRVLRQKPKVNQKKIERFNLIHRCISVAVIISIGLSVLPFGFNRVTKSILFKSPNPQIQSQFKQDGFPTVGYLNNHLFLNNPQLRGAETKKPLMTPLTEHARIVGIENGIKNLMTLYPTIKPSVYVWDYESGHYADINASEMYSAASIIKIPVLLQLFRSIESKQISLYDHMILTDYYRAEGSGGLQFKAENSKYTLDDLARIMITDSDNSATNMLMSKIGSMTDVNQGIRDWGLSHTHVKTWLPDLHGTNHTTARDLATMLYNIENPDFLSMSSREKIFDYMGHVKNNRLIQAGLGPGASLIHKTGDIGKMLGDAGIVYTPNGKKYIVVILANRPYNSVAGKDFIVHASEIIYNYMVK